MATVPSHKLGPGSLKLGATGSEVEFAVALRECAVEPDFKEDDAIPVLSGDEIAGDAEETYKLTGKILQSYDESSLLIWAQVHNGEQVPFTFRPDNDKVLTVKGTVTVRRLMIGGKVKERNESDIEWNGVGDYTLVGADGTTELAFTAPTGVTTQTDTSAAWN